MRTAFDRCAGAWGAGARRSVRGRLRGIGSPLAALKAACLTVVMAWGQGTSEAQIIEFQGGRIGLDVSGNWSPFGFSPSAGARGAMGAVTDLYAGPASLYGNPAGLASLPGVALQTDLFLPGMGLGVSSERTQLLRSNLRTPIREFLADGDNRVADPRYPEVEMGLYQSAGLSGFLAAYGRGGYGFGVGVEQPLQGSLDFSLGGARIGLGVPESEEEDADSLKILMAGDAFARLRASVHDFSLGAAGNPKPGWRIGVAYHRLVAKATLQAAAQLDGLLQRAGQEFSYNTGAAPYRDDLNASAFGEFEGVAHGFRLGTAYDILTWLGVDAVVQFTQSMKLSGFGQALYHLPAGLDPASEELLDPSAMNLTKLTLTRFQSHSIQDVEMEMPWEASLSLRLQGWGLRANLDYTYYLRNLGISFATADTASLLDEETQEPLVASDGSDSLEVAADRQTLRLKLRHQIALGLQWRQVFLHVGGIFYTAEQQGLLEESVAFRPDFLPFLPTFNGGYFFPLGPNITATVSLAAFPVSLFKTSIEVRY